MKHERYVSEQYAVFFTVLRNVPPAAVATMFRLNSDATSLPDWQRAVHLWARKPKLTSYRLLLAVGIALFIFAILVACLTFFSGWWFQAAIGLLCFPYAILAIVVFRPRRNWSQDYIDSLWRALKSAGHDPADIQFILRRDE
jgi:hypothetical protein